MIYIYTKESRMKTSYVLTLLAIVGFFLATPLYADQHTWDGGGDTAYWSNGTNWNQSNTAPAPGDNLRFLGQARTVTTNNITGGTSFNNILLNGTASRNGFGQRCCCGK